LYRKSQTPQKSNNQLFSFQDNRQSHSPYCHYLSGYICSHWLHGLEVVQTKRVEVCASGRAKWRLGTFLGELVFLIWLNFIFSLVTKFFEINYQVLDFWNLQKKNHEKLRLMHCDTDISALFYNAGVFCLSPPSSFFTHFYWLFRMFLGFWFDFLMNFYSIFQYRDLEGQKI
jgi:hypothetical protein